MKKELLRGSLASLLLVYCFVACPRKDMLVAQLRASSATRTASAVILTISSSEPSASSATAIALTLTVAEKAWASLSLFPTDVVPRSASKIIAVLSAVARASESIFLPGSGLGATGGGIGMLAGPSGRRAVSKRNNGFFDNGGKKSEHSKVGGGKLSGIIVIVRVVHHGLDELRLGGGVDHQGLDGLNIKEGFWRIGKGGVRPADVKGIVHIPVAAGTAALKGCGPIAEISGRVEQVAGDSARPALRSGDGRNKRTERDGFHYTW